MTDSIVAFYHFDRIRRALAQARQPAQTLQVWQAAPQRRAPASNNLPLLVRKRPDQAAAITASVGHLTATL
jgi:hypothetical protein